MNATRWHSFSDETIQLFCDLIEAAKEYPDWETIVIHSFEVIMSRSDAEELARQAGDPRGFFLSKRQ